MSPAAEDLEGIDAFAVELDEQLREAVRSPLDHIMLTEPQDTFLQLQHRECLLRGGNKIGKSLLLALHAIHTARGSHPYRQVASVPVRVLVVGESWEQMDGLLELLWELLPKHEIDPKVNYSQGAGFSGYKRPHIKFIRGPGKGSVIYFATYKQGAKRIAGGKYHLIILDEPPPDKVYGECLGRIGSPYFGDLRVNFTPTLDTHSEVEYLQKRVETGQCKEHQVSLNVNSVTPRGALIDIPWLSPEKIEAVLDSYLAVERPMREHGAWEPIRRGRYIDAFDERHWSTDYPPAGLNLVLMVAIDHGVKTGRQYAVLLACTEDGERIWFLDEAWQDKRTSSRQDAKNVIKMLARHGWTWRDVNMWVGDRAHGGDRYASAKSNADLMQGLSRELKMDASQLIALGLQIDTIYKARQSVSRGCRLLNDTFIENQALVMKEHHPVRGAGCPELRKAFLTWMGGKQDPAKDRVDAARYGVMTLVDQLVLYINRKQRGVVRMR